ncbi:crossover junction endodeoxyribonuclease RuvC [Candidatus Latescibacterota bacterium]
MIVLGIDPSSTSTGYGVLEGTGRRHRFIACGCIRPPRSASFDDRLVYLHHHLSETIEEYQPEQVAIESSFFGKDADAAAKLGEARGVIRLAVRQAGVEPQFYTPAEAKKAVVGNGQASKEQVQFMITRLLRLEEAPRPLDASDALAIALCHINRSAVAPQARTAGRRPEVEALLARVARR